MLQALPGGSKRRFASLVIPSSVEQLEGRVLLSASLVKDLNADPIPSSPTGIAALDGLAILAVRQEATGLEPYVSDGTSAGTKLLKDINPGPMDSNPSDFTRCNNQLFFTAADSEH